HFAAPHTDFHSFPTRRSSDLRVAHDIGEGFAEVGFEGLEFCPSEVRQAKHVRHVEQRMPGRHRLLLVDVERGESRPAALERLDQDRKSTRLYSSHQIISYAVF